MILHQFNQPGVLDRHRQYLGKGDAILLIENAVFDHVLLDELEVVERYVLTTDLERRGLMLKNQAIRKLSVTEWVALAARAQQCISWSQCDGRTRPRRIPEAARCVGTAGRRNDRSRSWRSTERHSLEGHRDRAPLLSGLRHFTHQSSDTKASQIATRF